ncbi:hypothetical protein GCU49_21120 [Modestobacter roseus]|nr:hypothetical protein [Modestobacter roseus]
MTPDGDPEDVDRPHAVVTRLRPLLLAVQEALAAGIAVSRRIHAEHGWQPSADRHLDHQLVRREAMERLRPFGAHLEDGPLSGQLDLLDLGTDNLGLPMSGLILHTDTDVLRVWHSDDGELPAADTQGLRAFYRQRPVLQTQLALGVPADAPTPRSHLALLWADGRLPGGGPGLVRFDLVRPRGTIGRRVDVDWHVGLLDRLAARAA